MTRSARTNIRLAFWTVALMMLICVWGDWTASVGAPQEDAAANPPEAAPEAPSAAADPSEGETAEAKDDSEEDDKESLGQVIWKSIKGSWFSLTFYVILGLFSITAMTVALERLVRLRRIRVMPRRFVRRLHDLVARKEDTVDNLRGLCDGSSAPVANVLRAGLLRAGRPLSEVEKAMEDAMAKEMAAMRSRNRPLSVIGTVAPLVGLLGTVVGMIVAFRVSSQAGLGKAILLAEGIYLALLTTAAGLTIAIPCLLLVAWFNTLVERFMRDIDETLLETLPSFTRVENKS